MPQVVRPRARTVREATVRAMGGGAHLVVVAEDPKGADRLLAAAGRRLAALEERWSRFLPDSEVSRLTKHAGRRVAVGPDTRLLVRRAVDAWRRTGGRFDPTVLPALVAAGYDETFDVVLERPPREDRTTPGRAPGCADVVVDDVAGTVRLPAGCGFDPGGIGKGLAADLVCEDLLADGAAGALVNVGGDLRVAGEPPGPDGWVVGIEHPTRPGLLAVVRLDGPFRAVASSSVRERRWAGGHHLVDPRTGRPTTGGVVAATVLAADAAWADAATKTAFVAGSPAGAVRAFEECGVVGMVVDDEGACWTAGRAVAAAATS